MAARRKPAAQLATEKIETQIRETYEKAAPLSQGIRALICTLAAVIQEENMLQHFVNVNGTTYKVVGKSGDEYSRSRPEWQQLKEARLRKQSLIQLLESKVASAPEMDEVDELLAMKR